MCMSILTMHIEIDDKSDKIIVSDKIILNFI